MLGWRPAAHAKILGFTHHGSYYGIPVYLGFDRDPKRLEIEGPMVAVKWWPMEFVFDLFSWMEGFARPMMFPDDEPVFQFKVGDPL